MSRSRRKSSGTVVSEMIRCRASGTPLDVAEAIQRAEGVNAATGQAFDHAIIRGTGTPLYANGHSWLIGWQRVYGEIPYWGQLASVRLQASSGDPLSLHLNFLSEPAALPQVQISGQQAEATARKSQSDWAGLSDTSASLWTQTARDGLRAAGVESLHPDLRLYVVLPNQLWPSGDPALAFALSPLPRIAWSCQFNCDENQFVFWRDAETGAVIGGSTSGGSLGGCMDHYVTTYGGNRLFRNNGDGASPKAPRSVGLAQPAVGSALLPEISTMMETSTGE